MFEKTKIFIYPPVSDQEDLNNVVSRLAWYLSPFVDQIDSIQLSVPDQRMLGSVALAPNLDAEILARIPMIQQHLVFRSPRGLAHEISFADAKRDIVLLIKDDAEAGAPAGLKARLAEFARNGGRYRVDPLKTRQEGSFYLWAGLNKLSNIIELTALYAARFSEMAAEIGEHEKAYVFGTGPSFSDFVGRHDFSDGLCIVANSIVKNKDALERLKPRIICAADPIYHAGASAYAAAFRKALLEALEETGAWFVCPLRDAGVYRAFLPAHLERRMVCVPFDKARGIPIDLASNFFIYPFPNVLTLLLLPLASTFAQSIHIAGCDGRKLLDDSFFWSHDKKVQFNDEMAGIQAAHPGFFTIDYNDYYLDHCLDLEKVLAALKLHGKTIVNETPSLIPALNVRTPKVDQDEPDLRTFVMLDPDAKDDWGHFLAYDKRLAMAARANGLNFALLSRSELATKFKPAAATSMHPVFTINSWTVGNKTPAERENVLKFARELDQGLSEVEERYQEGDICVFFYVGSLEAAEVLEFLLAQHPRMHGVINLFWSYNFDQTDPAYQERWKTVAKRMNAHQRLHLTHATEQIADEFARDRELELPVLEHPSTTFSDNEAAKLAACTIAQRTDATPYRVLFPGGARAEKGFVLSIDSCTFLRDEPDLALALRSRLDKVSGPKLKRAFDALDKTGIEIIDQDLSDDEFIDMVRSADIVVIPYCADAFRRRTSGILVDAMLLGKPVVVLQDTWLADIVSVEQTGVCVAPNARALADGVLTVARDYPVYVRHIEAARKAYLEKNTWSVLVRHVCALTGDKSFAADPIVADEGDFALRLITAAAELLLGHSVPGAPPRVALCEAIERLGPEHPVCQHFARVEDFAARRLHKPQAVVEQPGALKTGTGDGACQAGKT